MFIVLMPKGHYERRGHPRLRVDDKLNVIGVRAELRRAELGVTQIEVCARIELETEGAWRPMRTEYGRIGNGKRTVSDAELLILARVLDCDPCWLLLGSSADRKYSSTKPS